MVGKILGIDLGTSNTAACIINDDGKLDMIPSHDGASQYGKSFPSYVAITKNDELLVGEPAKKYGNKFPENTISEIKRHMGDKNYKIEIQGKKLSPQQVSAHILSKVKKDAYEYTGEDIKDVVITVPAYFDNNQRTATIDAGRIAGLNVKKLIDEPSAASIAYGIDKQKENDLNILVFDIGGGTLDVSIMELFGGNFHVQAVGGDKQCGGTDMDAALMYYIAGKFEKEHGINLLDDPINRELLKRDAEEAKIELSTSFETDVYERRIAEKNNESIDLDITITRSELEEVVSPIVEKFGVPIQDALDDAIMTAEDIDKVILVGGPTRMPIVRKYVEEYLGRAAEFGIDPMESVCKGAAIFGAMILDGTEDTGIDEVNVHPVNPLSLGTEVHDGSTSIIINKNAPLPISKSRKYTTVRDNQTSVTINVVQGERIMAIDNTEIGSFILNGIPPAKRGVPQIEVTFKVDDNGILKASAVEKVTGIKQSITIEGALEMSDEEIERCKREAEEFEEIDKPKPIIQKAINDANYAIENAKNILEDSQFEGKISTSDKEKIQNLISKLEMAIVNKTLLELNVLTVSLNNVLSKFNSN